MGFISLTHLQTALNKIKDIFDTKANKLDIPTDFVKSGSGAKAGLVPAPSTTEGTTKYLCEDGTWTVPPDTTYSAATTSVAGLMSAEDKAKLDGIENNAEANVQSDWNIADENSDAFIKNKPESLPANGGNADTLDGFHAKEITSNPNLLINPDFKVNQRGSTTYTGKCYTVDRWFNSTDYTVSTITDNGIKIGMINPSGGTSNITIGQIGTNLEPETVNLLKGKTITFSINVTELTAVGAKMMIFERNESDEPTYTTVKIASTGINTCKTTIKNDTTKIDVRIYGVDTKIDGEVYTNYTNVQWAKLEVGSFPTIFTPPDHNTELEKCLRYYVRYSGRGFSIGGGFISIVNAAWIQLNAVTQMRIKPSLKFSGSIYITTKNKIGDNAFKSTSLIYSYADRVNPILAVNISNSDESFIGAGCYAQFRDRDSYLELDAEMDI